MRFRRLSINKQRPAAAAAPIKNQCLGSTGMVKNVCRLFSIVAALASFCLAVSSKLARAGSSSTAQPRILSTASNVSFLASGLSDRQPASSFLGTCSCCSCAGVRHKTNLTILQSATNHATAVSTVDCSSVTSFQATKVIRPLMKKTTGNPPITMHATHDGTNQLAHNAASIDVGRQTFLPLEPSLCSDLSSMRSLRRMFAPWFLRRRFLYHGCSGGSRTSARHRRRRRKLGQAASMCISYRVSLGTIRASTVMGRWSKFPRSLVDFETKDCMALSIDWPPELVLATWVFSIKRCTKTRQLSPC